MAKPEDEELRLSQPRWPVILASSSPRRKDLLARLLEEFVVDPPIIDEDLDPRWPLPEAVSELAMRKARAVSARRPDCLIVAGDTVVALHGRLFGKPQSKAEAEETLHILSGRTHQVITGVAVRWPNGAFELWDVAHVTFRNLGLHEIEAYVQTGEPMDKAGSYAIQGGAAEFVEDLDGCLDTVIGLPVAKLRDALLRVGLCEG